MRILSLDGGGIKGAGEAQLLARLDHETGLLDKVEMFSGTSTGGIIALALAAGVPVEECVALYRDNGAAIFGNRDWKDTVAGALDELIRANFSQKALRELLEEVFGDKRLPDLEREVLIPTFDVARFRPKLLDRSDDWSLVDAALATSAAPTYFPTHVVRESFSGRATARGAVRAFVDGGMYANNPADRAIMFASAKLGEDPADLTVLSIGAGAPPYKPIDELLDERTKNLDWGIKQWVINKPNLLFKILFDGSVEAAHFAAKGMLRDRYHRVNPTLPEDVDLAAYEKIPLILSVADAMDLDPTVEWINTHWS